MREREVDDEAEERPGRASGGRASLASRLALAAASVLALVLVLEVGLRLAGYGARPERLEWIADPELQYVAAPSQDTWFGKDAPETGEVPLPIRINRYGQRGADYPLAKPPGELRIVGVGDSLTFGPGVHDDETYLARLEAALRDRGRDARVVNAAANGWGTWHYRRWAETRLERFAPDLLIVGCYPANDMSLPTEMPGTQYVPFERVLRRSALFRFAVEAYREHLWKRVRASRRGVSLEEVDAELERYVGVAESELTMDERRALWMHALSHLERIAALCSAQSVELVVLLIPDHSATSKDANPAFDQLRAEIEARGMAVVDPTAALRPHHSELWLDYDQGHLNAVGHARLAEALLAGLDGLAVLPAE